MINGVKKYLVVSMKYMLSLAVLQSFFWPFHLLLKVVSNYVRTVCGGKVIKCLFFNWCSEVNHFE